MDGLGSMTCGVWYRGVGVDSFDSLSNPHVRSKNDGVDDELILCTVAFAAIGIEIPSTLSNSGVSWGMMDFQPA